MTTHPSLDQLGAASLKVAGFQLWVHGRQFPDSTDYYDGNWLRVSAHCGCAGASVWATGSILMVTDLVSWAKECDQLLRKEAKQATLNPMEPNLCVTIKSTDALGHFSLSVEITPEHLSQRHTMEFEIDQTYLPELIRQCRQIEKEHPIRGTKPE